MDLSKGGGKGSESVPGVTGSPGGSPTRMEMGTASAQVAADTPVPETPPNGLASNQQGFCMGGQCFGGCVNPVPNLAGVTNLAGGQNLAGASNLAGVPYLAGQNLAGNQFPFPFQSGVGTSGFVGTQNFGCAQNVPCQQGVILVVDVSINRLLLGIRVLKKEFVRVLVDGCLQVV